MSLHRVTPDPVSNRARTDFPPMFTLAFGLVNSGLVGLKQLSAVGQDMSFWGMSLPIAIPPCQRTIFSYWIGLGIEPN